MPLRAGGINDTRARGYCHMDYLAQRPAPRSGVVVHGWRHGLLLRLDAPRRPHQHRRPHNLKHQRRWCHQRQCRPSGGGRHLRSTATGRPGFEPALPTMGAGDSALGWFSGAPCHTGGSGHDGSAEGASFHSLFVKTRSTVAGGCGGMGRQQRAYTRPRRRRQQRPFVDRSWTRCAKVATASPRSSRPSSWPWLRRSIGALEDECV